MKAGTQTGRAGQMRQEMSVRQTFMKAQSRQACRQAVQGRLAMPGKSGMTEQARWAGQIRYTFR
jgi:hypothetical protein